MYGLALAGGPIWPIVALAAVALVAAPRASVAVGPFVLCATFLVSFFPIGLYLTSVPGYPRWIALRDVLYPVAAGMVLVARGYRGARDPSTRIPGDPSTSPAYKNPARSGRERAGRFGPCWSAA